MTTCTVWLSPTEILPNAPNDAPKPPKLPPVMPPTIAALRPAVCPRYSMACALVSSMPQPLATSATGLISGVPSPSPCPRLLSVTSITVGRSGAFLGSFSRSGAA